MNFSGVLTKLSSSDENSSISINDVGPPVPDDREGRTIKRYVQVSPTGFSNEDISQLKAAYRVIYRSELAWKEVLARLGTQSTTGPVHLLTEFLAGGERGFVQARRSSSAPTLRLVEPEKHAPKASAVRKAG